MKRLFFGCLAVLGLAVAVAMAIDHDPGYVLISYSRWTLETSVWLAGVLLAGTLVLLWLLLRLVHSLLRRSRLFGRWFQEQSHRRGQRRTNRGLVAWVEGNWERARRDLERGADGSDTPVLNYLMAARASHELGDNQSARRFLGRAEDAAGGEAVAVQLTQARMQLDNGQLEESLATLTRARAAAGHHPHVLRLLRDVYAGLGAWEKLLQLLPDLRRHTGIDSEELDTLEKLAWLEHLSEIGVRSAAEGSLESVWKSLPRRLRKDPDLVARYAGERVRRGEQAAAEKLLREYLSKHWRRDLVLLYGRIEGADAGLQLATAEKWLRDRTNDAALLLTLGRLSLRNHFWGKAREYFESSLRLERNLEVCAELGRLLENLGEHEQSAAYFHEGLQLGAHDMPALPLPEPNRLHALGRPKEDS